MKKKLALIMAGIMAITMTACSKDESVKYDDETEEVSDSADKGGKKDKDSDKDDNKDEDKDEDAVPAETEPAETTATEATTVTEATTATEPEVVVTEPEQPESPVLDDDDYAAFELLAGDYCNCVDLMTSEDARDKWYNAVCEAYGTEFTDEEFDTIIGSALSEENLEYFDFPLPNGAAKLSINSYGTIEVFGADGSAVCSGSYDLIESEDGVYVFQDKTADVDFEYGTLLVTGLEGFDGMLTGAFETNGYFNSMDDIHLENMFIVLSDEGLDSLIGYVMDVALSVE